MDALLDLAVVQAKLFDDLLSRTLLPSLSPSVFANSDFEKLIGILEPKLSVAFLQRLLIHAFVSKSQIQKVKVLSGLTQNALHLLEVTHKVSFSLSLTVVLEKAIWPKGAVLAVGQAFDHFLRLWTSATFVGQNPWGEESQVTKRFLVLG